MVAARLGDGIENATCRLTDFGAEVLRLNLVFLNGNLWERVAERTEVLAEHTAMIDGILEAHPVEQHVRVVGVQRTHLELLRPTRVGKGDARREDGEAQEVARVLRQVLDLSRGDVGRDSLGLCRRGDTS